MNVDENRICTELWKEHEPGLRRLCNLKLKSCPNEVDDIIAEVFLILCNRVSQSGVPENPGGWLYGTLNNIVKKKYKELKQLRDKVTSFSDEEYILPYGKDDINGKTDEIFIEEIMKKADRVLTADEQELINQIYYEDLTMKEIAALHNKTEGAIKQKHYRIRVKMKKIRKKF